MGSLHRFIEQRLTDGQITADEVDKVREELAVDGQIDYEDVKLLVELYVQAKGTCEEFDDLFFEVLESVFLSDGQIDGYEQFFLLKMLYSDQVIRDRERQFLQRLQSQLSETSDEFAELCATALSANSTGWNVGGRG